VKAASWLNVCRLHPSPPPKSPQGRTLLPNRPIFHEISVLLPLTPRIQGKAVPFLDQVSTIKVMMNYQPTTRAPMARRPPMSSLSVPELTRNLKYSTHSSQMGSRMAPLYLQTLVQCLLVHPMFVQRVSLSLCATGQLVHPAMHKA